MPQFPPVDPGWHWHLPRAHFPPLRQGALAEHVKVEAGATRRAERTLCASAPVPARRRTAAATATRSARAPAPQGARRRTEIVVVFIVIALLRVEGRKQRRVQDARPARGRGNNTTGGRRASAAACGARVLARAQLRVAG